MSDEKKLVFTADIGGTHIRIGAANIDTLDKEGSLSLFDASSLNSDNPAKSLADMALSHAEKTGVKPVAFVVGIPGSFDDKMDTVIRCNNIPSIVGRPFASEVSQYLGCPVFLEHDLMLHILGETSVLDRSGSPTSAGVYFGTGIGCDILLHDRPYRLSGTSFELGHIPYRLDGKKCLCGMNGCAEVYSNGHLLFEIAEKENCRIDEVFKFWGTDTEAGETLKELVDVEAMCVATVSQLFTPKYMILGGGIPFMKGFPKEYLTDTVREHLSEPYPRNSMQFIWARMGDWGAVLGGLRDYFYRIQN